ncbi:MAG: MFS transporter [Acetobacteraceae bacterium]
MPTAARERRWGLIAAIASVTVFGLSVGQAAPLLPLLLEQRGLDVTLNGLNAGATFLGVIAGPLLAPRLVRWFGVRDLLVACFVLDIVLTLSLKLFDSLGAWFVLRILLGLVGSTIFTSAEAWINQLARDGERGRIIGIYAAALSAGFGLGPVLLTLTGINGWAPFLVNAAVVAVALLPLFAAGKEAGGFGRERGGSPIGMFLRAPLIMVTVAAFGLYEAALMSLLPIWGLHTGLGEQLATTILSAVYIGSIIMQVLIGWLSDRLSRVLALLLCSVVGLLGATLMLVVPTVPLLLFALVFVWGGLASGIYPVALSMAGDRFRGPDLVTVNAAIIISYGVGGLVGPALGGMAMQIDDPRGLLWLFVALFGGLLATTLPSAARVARQDRIRRRAPATAGPPPPPGTA